jgi:hypothetical protein
MGTLHNGKSWKNQSPEYRAGMLKKAYNAGLQSLGDREETNREFAEKNGSFREACTKAGISPSVRQASKYRRKMGKAYNA